MSATKEGESTRQRRSFIAPGPVCCITACLPGRGPLSTSPRTEPEAQISQAGCARPFTISTSEEAGRGLKSVGLCPKASPCALSLLTPLG